MITQSYTLSLQPGGVPLRVPCVQGDALSRTLSFSLTSGGAAASLPTGAAVLIEGTKPDGKSFSVSGALDGNVVTVSLTQQMTVLAGEVPCQITISSGSKLLGTARFLLEVAPSAIPSSPDLSETELSAFTQLKNTALQAAARAETAATSAETAAAALTSQSWTPVLSGAESYTYRHGTYAVIGNLAIIAFSVSGTFSSSASGHIVISGCPTWPTIKAAGGGYLSGYYAAEDLVFSGWSLNAETGYIAPVLHWATTAGTKYINTAQQAPGAKFEASGTIAFPIA